MSLAGAQQGASKAPRERKGGQQEVPDTTQPKLALFLPPSPAESWRLALQIGVKHATTKAVDVPGAKDTPWGLPALTNLKSSFEDAGLDLLVYETGLPVRQMDEIRLGGPDRDLAIECFCQLLRNLGRVDIPIVSWTWQLGRAWRRTRNDARARGDSLVTAFDVNQIAADLARPTFQISETELWENLEHFLVKVVPVAQEAEVKMALHPADPPIETLGGIPQVIRSVAAYDRALSIKPSPYNGVCFCQGCITEMGTDIPKAIRHFGDKIHYVHFRDVRGSKNDFVETWVDDGPTDMLKAMRAYQEIGFTGPMRPDHVPTMAGESNSNPGYEMKGRLFAIGYMKGLLEQCKTARPAVCETSV